MDGSSGAWDTVDALIARGEAAQAVGDAAGALKAYGSALAIDPTNATAGLHMAGALHTSGRYREAIDIARRALAQDLSPSYRCWGLRQISSSNLAMGRRAKAIEAARDAIAASPSEAAPRVVLARAFMYQRRSYGFMFSQSRRKSLRLAHDALNEAVRLDPGYVTALIALADVLLAMRRYAKAQEAILHAVALAPGRIDVILARGRIAFWDGRIEEARDLALWVLSREATDRAALRLLGMVRSRQSWFFRPAWIFSAWSTRQAAWMVFISRMGIFGVLLLLVMLSESSYRTHWLGPVCWYGVCLYAALASAHVAWLVQRDLRAVRLNRDF